VSEQSSYLVKTLDLSSNGLGFPTIYKVNEIMFRNILLKYGQYIHEIIYKGHKLQPNIDYRLTDYISMYCFNVKNLNLTASRLHPSQIKILAEKCKNIEKLSLYLCSVCQFEDELTMLFEENKNLKDISLCREILCPSLLKLPEHKMRAIKLNVVYFTNALSIDIFSSVSIL